MPRRSIPKLMLLGGLLIAGPGCRSFHQGGLRGPELTGEAPVATLTLKEQIDRHNTQVAQVSSAKVPDMTVEVASYQTAGGRERATFMAANLSGVLMVERPRNARLQLRHPAKGEVADIGSNSQEFWMSDSMNKQIVVGRYEQMQADPMAAAFQPEWILEILGLQPISPKATPTKGKVAGTYLLTEKRAGAGGQTLTKETVINEADGRILEHTLKDSNGKVIARAVVKGQHPIPVVDGDAAAGPTIEVAQSVELDVPNFAKLQIRFDDAKLNPSSGFSAEAFVRPTMENQGYALHDIREVMAAGDRSVASAEPAPEEPAPATPARRSRAVRFSDPSNDSASAVDLRSSLESSRAPQATEPTEVLVGYDDDLPRGSDLIRRSSWQAVSPSNSNPRRPNTVE